MDASVWLAYDDYGVSLLHKTPGVHMTDTEEIKIGHLVLQPDRQLLNDGERISIGSKALRIISTLAAAKGELVTKDELMESFWPGLIVEENSIQVHVTALRKALGLEAERLITVRGLGYRLFVDGPPALPLPTKPSVAVLPFASLSQGGDDDYFADGMVVEIVSALSRFQSLFVISSGSTLAYHGDTRGPTVIADELGVRYILQGTVRKAANKVRIAAELLDGDANVPIWTQRFDGVLDDVFGLQDEVASAVAARIDSSIQANELRRARARPTDQRAYDRFLRASHKMCAAYGAHGLIEAVKLFDQAIERDPRFALAMAMCSNACFSLQERKLAADSAGMRAKCLTLAQRVIQTDMKDYWVLA
jgi:TolB-like protein